VGTPRAYTSIKEVGDKIAKIEHTYVTDGPQQTVTTATGKHNIMIKIIYEWIAQTVKHFNG